MTEEYRKEKIDFKYNLKTYFGFLFRYKALFASIIAVTLANDVTRLADKLVFKSLVDNGTLFVAGSLTKSLMIDALLAIAFVFSSLILIRSVGKWFSIWLINRMETSMMADVKRKYFNHIIHLSHNFHTTHKTGSMISRVSRGSGATERLTDFIVFNIAPLIFQSVIVIFSLIYFDATSAVVVAAMCFVFITYSIFVQHLQKPANQESNRAEDREKGNISDIFTNIDSIKYFGKEENMKKKYENLTEDSKSTLRRFYDYYCWFDAGHTLIIGIGTFLLMYFPLTKFLEGQMTLGTLVFIFTIYGNILEPLFGFVHGIRGFYRSMTDFNDLFQYGKIDNEIKDEPGAEKLKIRDGRIEFRNVSFRYNNRKLFENFSLEIPKHKKVALVGHSGSGKSTIVKMLYRLYDVDEGEVIIDGKNVKGFNQESLRSELSIVPQECVLFDDTIYNNILFSRPEAGRDEVMRAMKFAQIDRIVETFPNKENTIVGERGVKLSGGEKQRVSIARAILADKKVLVLDEATSALDSQTEHDIQADLAKLMEGRTSIIIAHRLSTIMHADKIVVLEDGKIVQTGTHAQLIKKQGVYKKLWNLQKGGYIK